ncbi:MAG: hypothetical protein K6T91_11325 [Firmicutes bacterium]|nr:hypothetical protein [Bacillota bacterium]
MDFKKIKVFAVLLIVLGALFLGSPAFAYTAAADGSWWFTVWYPSSGVLVPFSCYYSSHLRETYDVYATSWWKIYNHQLGGVYYVANGYTYPFPQTVAGNIVFYNNGSQYTSLGLTPDSSSIYPSGYLPWGGHNWANVYIPRGGTDYVAGNSTWSSYGSTLPSTVSRTIKYYY